MAQQCAELRVGFYANDRKSVAEVCGGITTVVATDIKDQIVFHASTVHNPASMTKHPAAPIAILPQNKRLIPKTTPTITIGVTASAIQYPILIMKIDVPSV